MTAIIVTLPMADRSLLVSQTHLLITHRVTAHRSLATAPPSGGHAETTPRDDRDCSAGGGSAWASPMAAGIMFVGGRPPQVRR